MAKIILENTYKDLCVDSCGTLSMSSNNRNISKNTKLLLESKYNKLFFNKSKRITKELAEKYDYILVMQDSNYKFIKKNYNCCNIIKLYDFIGKKQISDPYYTKDYEGSFNEIETALKYFIKSVI